MENGWKSLQNVSFEARFKPPRFMSTSARSAQSSASALALGASKRAS